MSREYEGYEKQIERIDRIFPGRMSLTKKEVARLEGKKDARTVEKMFLFNDGMISVEAYARHLCRKDLGLEPRYLNRKKGANKCKSTPRNPRS